MFTLQTHIELPIAHRLPDAYSGLCVGNVSRDGNTIFNNADLGIIHGHNYNITFYISSNSVNSDFMVMDFKQVKSIIHSEMDKYDHALILKKGDKLIDIYTNEYAHNNIDIRDTRLYIWEEAPTAEYMAYYWYKIFMNKFKEAGINVNKLAITVEETSHNSVTYTE